MKFLVDAHLPPSLCFLLREAGHSALHTLDLPRRNLTPDAEISELSVREQWVVISKDADFYHSHLLLGKPWKLLLVRTGNIGTADLKKLFGMQLGTIILALESCTLVELDHHHVAGLA